MAYRLLLATLLCGPALAPYEAADEREGEVVAEIVGEEIEYAVEEPEPEEEEEVDEQEPASPPLPSPSGYLGLVRAMSAPSGHALGWSVGFHASFFVERGFLYTHGVEDEHTHFTGTLHGSFTPVRFLELFLAVGFRVDSTDLDIQDPGSYRRLGNSLIGLKGILPLADFATLALAVVPRFYVEMDDAPFDWDATSVTLMLAQTFYLAPRTPVPLRIHLNLGWDFNNSARLVDKREREMTGEAGFAQYVMRFERFVLDVTRTDLLLLVTGLEVSTTWVAPFVEWAYRIPVERTGFDCLPRMTVAFPDDDSCLDVEGASASHMNLVLGLRFQPRPVPGLSFLAAADLALTAVGKNVRELPANPPYRLYLGVSYSGKGKAGD